MAKRLWTHHDLKCFSKSCGTQGALIWSCYSLPFIVIVVYSSFFYLSLVFFKRWWRSMAHEDNSTTTTTTNMNLIPNPGFRNGDFEASSGGGIIIARGRHIPPYVGKILGGPNSFWCITTLRSFCLIFDGAIFFAPSIKRVFTYQTFLLWSHYPMYQKSSDFFFGSTAQVVFRE